MEDKEKTAYEGNNNCSRRSFLSTALGSLLAVGMASEALAEGEEPVKRPERVNPERKGYIVPFGARSLANFHRRCVGCQLCVSNCPSRVLNVKASHKVIKAKYGLLNLEQPAMSFENGYCRPECVKCSQVCPAGAILPLSASRKTALQVGLAEWNGDVCRNSNGIPCTACQKICPNGALTAVPLESDPKQKQIVVDPERCMGCGACEYICPCRPAPAICVNGLEVHRSV